MTKTPQNLRYALPDEEAPASDRGASPDSGKPSRKGKHRASQQRPKRWLERLKLITGILVVAAASILVAWGLRRYLHQSPRFSVRSVHVDGNVRRSAHQISKRAGIEIGKNIFLIEEQAAAKLIRDDPWVESAKVRRELPSTIRIEVTEREPRLLVSLRGKLYLVDTKGALFKEARSGDPMDFPVVTGITAKEVARDREAVVLRLRRVLDLMADFERKNVTKRFPVQEITVRADGTLTVMVGSEAIVLEFGRQPYRNKVAKVARIFSELDRRRAKPARIFLDNEAHPERVVVRMR